MSLALQHFEVSVSCSPSPVVLHTDQSPLVFLAQMRNHNQHLMRWALFVQGYKLNVQLKRGAVDIVADALSHG